MLRMARTPTLRGDNMKVQITIEMNDLSKVADALRETGVEFAMTNTQEPVAPAVDTYLLNNFIEMVIRLESLFREAPSKLRLSIDPEMVDKLSRVASTLTSMMGDNGVERLEKALTQLSGALDYSVLQRLEIAAGQMYYAAQSQMRY